MFRIIHVANLPWSLTNGLHAANSAVSDPDFIAIGNADLIDKRTRHAVRVPPGGTLADYVPFYFTPRSPMMMNIRTGWKAIVKRPNTEIAVLVSSCRAMTLSKVTMLYTDRHAYTAMARWSSESADLATMIDWNILQRHDFASSEDYPDKMERYMAEALAYHHVPTDALLGIGCVDASLKSAIEAQVSAAGVAIRVVVRPEWYF